MNIDKNLNELLLSWENTYKKGQLTLWIFMALQESKKYVDEIKTFILEKSGGTIRSPMSAICRGASHTNIQIVFSEISCHA